MFRLNQEDDLYQFNEIVEKLKNVGKAILDIEYTKRARDELL